MESIRKLQEDKLFADSEYPLPTSSKLLSYLQILQREEIKSRIVKDAEKYRCAVGLWKVVEKLWIRQAAHPALHQKEFVLVILATILHSGCLSHVLQL